MDEGDHATPAKLTGGYLARVAYVDQEIKEDEVNIMIAALRRSMQLTEAQAALVAEVAASEISKGMDYYRSYPGHCRRYTDGNDNGLCDYGECL